MSYQYNDYEPPPELKPEVVRLIEQYFDIPIQHVRDDRLYAIHVKNIGGIVWLILHETYVVVIVGQSERSPIVHSVCNTPHTEWSLLETIKASLRQLHVQYASYQLHLQKILSKD